MVGSSCAARFSSSPPHKHKPTHTQAHTPASHLILILIFVFAVHLDLVCAQNGPTDWTADPFNPPSLPIAVRNPYLNGWLAQGNLPGSTAQTWTRLYDTGELNLEWYAAVRVDGTPYKIYGNTNTPSINGATEKLLQFTPTQSSFLLSAGSVDVNMTFLSPIEPSNITQLSMPFSYMFLTFTSNDGNSHDVSVYADVSGEWMCGIANAPANWTGTEDSSIVYMQMQLQNPVLFGENSNRPEDAAVYHATTKTDGVKWQIANGDLLRSDFANGTALSDSANSTFGGVSDPVVNTLSFTIDPETVTTSTSDPLVFTLGVVRDPAIHYTNGISVTQARSPYYWSQFSSISDVITQVLASFSTALAASASLDSAITSAASSISTNYSAIISLATRQAMGAIEYTLSTESSGSLNTSDVMAFIKNMGIVGSGGINAVDVIYGAMPVFLYLNPSILGYLLEPLMLSQEGSDANSFAAVDVGTYYPNATTPNLVAAQAIENSASMIIMSLAYAQASGDTAFLSRHYSLLNSWAGYLSDNAMNPGQQTTSSSDGLFMSNQSNLALKGIIGIGAMAEISDFVGQSSDKEKFNSTASDYASQWKSLVTLSNGLAISFGGSSSGLLYNLYADKLLGLQLIDSSAYNLQTDFYKIEAANWTYGIPLDSSNSSSFTRADWMLFAAAAVSDNSVRDAMIDQVYAYVSANIGTWPFPVIYTHTNASQIGGASSPSIGALFAPLVLSASNSTLSGGGSGSGSDSGNGSGSSSSSSQNIGAIAGGIVGGVVLIILGGIIAFIIRRHKHSSTATSPRVEPYEPHNHIEENKTFGSSTRSAGASPSQLNTPSSFLTAGIPARYRHFITPYSLHNSPSSPKSGKSSEWSGTHQKEPASEQQEQDQSDHFSEGDVTAGLGLASLYHVATDVKTNPEIVITRSESSRSSQAREVAPNRDRTQTESALRNEVDMLRMQVQRMEARFTGPERGVDAEAEALPSYEEEIERSNRTIRSNEQ